MSLRVGTQGRQVSDWQRTMLRRFPAYALAAGGGPLKIDGYFGRDDLATHQEWQRRVQRTVTEEVSDEELVMLGLVPSEDSRPVVVTVAGHQGDMFTGPAYLSARVLEQKNKVRVQPVGYDNWSIPFTIDAGIAEVERLIHDPVVLPRGTRWAIASHSEGAIVASTWWRDIASTKLTKWPYSHMEGGLAFGNPMRPRDIVAGWVNDPPDAGTEGLANDCLENPIPGVEEVSRKGDLYADKTIGDDASEWKTSIYRAVAQGEFFGHDSLSEQLTELAFDIGSEVWAVFRACIGGLQFAVDMRPHNDFDLGPCIDHLSQVLKV